VTWIVVSGAVEIKGGDPGAAHVSRIEICDT
jgi:hypothetical protein